MTTSRRSRSRARRSTEARDPSQVPAVAAMYGSDLFHLAKGLDMGLEQPRPDRDSLWDWIVRDLPQSLSAFRMPQERHVKQVAEGGLRWVALTFSAGWGKDAERREQERLRDLIATYHKYGIQVLGYISMANVFARRVFKDIPGSKDWVQRDPEGEPIPYRGWKTETGTRVLACVNHPDFRAHQMDLVRRAMRFGCDGLLVDNVFGTCYCKHCRAAFREFARERMGTRRLLPLEDLETADWSRPVIRLAAEFFAESVQRFFARIRKAARRINRDAVCTMNVHPPRWRVRPTFDFPRLVRHCDIVISEDGALPASRSFKEVFETGQLQELSRSDLGRDNIDHYRYLRAVAKGRPFLFDAHHAWSVEPNHLKLALAEAFSCGGGLGFAVPPGYDPGRESLLKASGEYLTFFDEHRRLYEGASHVAQVAVLVSHRSMIWCLSRDERGRPNEPIRTATHLWGFSQALIYNNVPFDYVLEEDLSAKALSPYSVVILPNAVCLSDAALEAVNQFVRAGGSLVVVVSMAWPTSRGSDRGAGRAPAASSAASLARRASPTSWPRSRATTSSRATPGSAANSPRSSDGARTAARSSASGTCPASWSSSTGFPLSGPARAPRATAGAAGHRPAHPPTAATTASTSATSSTTADIPTATNRSSAGRSRSRSTWPPGRTRRRPSEARPRCWRTATLAVPNSAQSPLPRLRRQHQKANPCERS